MITHDFRQKLSMGSVTPAASLNAMFKCILLCSCQVLSMMLGKGLPFRHSLHLHIPRIETLHDTNMEQRHNIAAAAAAAATVLM